MSQIIFLNDQYFSTDSLRKLRNSIEETILTTHTDAPKEVDHKKKFAWIMNEGKPHIRGRLLRRSILHALKLTGAPLLLREPMRSIIAKHVETHLANNIVTSDLFSS